MLVKLAKPPQKLTSPENTRAVVGVMVIRVHLLLAILEKAYLKSNTLNMLQCYNRVGKAMQPTKYVYQEH
jgi:hypothetical protein